MTARKPKPTPPVVPTPTGDDGDTFTVPDVPTIDDVIAKGNAERDRLLGLGSPEEAAAFGLEEDAASDLVVIPDAPTIAEHDAGAVADLGETEAPAVPELATDLEELVDPAGTLEETVDELATNASKVGPLILELTCDGSQELGYFELSDGTAAARVYIDAAASPLELEPFLAALGAPFTSCGRTADGSVPAELADAWGRRYARAARIEE